MKDFYVFHVVSKGVPAIIRYASYHVICWWFIRQSKYVGMYRRNYRALSNRGWKELRYVEVSIQPRDVRPWLQSRRWEVPLLWRKVASGRHEGERHQNESLQRPTRQPQRSWYLQCNAHNLNFNVSIQRNIEQKHIIFCHAQRIISKFDVINGIYSIGSNDNKIHVQVAWVH